MPGRRRERQFAVSPACVGLVRRAFVWRPDEAQYERRGKAGGDWREARELPRPRVEDDEVFESWLAADEPF